MTNAASGTVSAMISPPSAKPARLQRMVYWFVTGLVAIAFVLPGVANLARAPHIADDMVHLGYPTYFMSILGVWKILGAAAILVPGFPRVKEWAYAGMMFDLSGAVVSRTAVGDGAAKTIIPVAIASLVAASWALRPGGRAMTASKDK